MIARTSHRSFLHRFLWPGMALLALAALAACSPRQGKAPHKSKPIKANAEVSASASLGPFDAHINALAFAPVNPVPWEGRLVVALATGGLKSVDVEGQEDSSWSGAAFSALAIVPGYNLRGLNVSLLLGVDGAGAVRSFIVDDVRGQLVEAPVQGLPAQGASTVCAMSDAKGPPRFLIGMADKSVALWSLNDTGGAQLAARKETAGKLAVPLGHCAYAGGFWVAMGAKGGLMKLSVTDKVRLQGGIESAPGDVQSLVAHGKRLVLVSDAAAGVVRVYDAALKPLYALSAPKALSTPGAAVPGAMATSAHSFGGSGFSAGLLAVADDSTNRIALIVLDTVPLSAKKPQS